MFLIFLCAACGTGKNIKNIAEECIGDTVEELYDAIGEADYTEEGTSCLEANGKDIFLYYEESGFYVYVLQKEDGTKIVKEIIEY